MERKASASTLSMVQLALFSAIILAMAFTLGLGYIPLGVTRATIIHLPVIIGGILLGPKKGAFLGGVFGLTSLINNTINPTVTSFTFSPFYSGGNLWSLVICFIPRILIGVVAYYVYKALCLLWKAAGKQKNNLFDIVSLGAAGLLGSMTNTVLVMGLIYYCFGKSYAAAKGIGFEALYDVILGVVAVNGVLEALVAAVIADVPNKNADISILDLGTGTGCIAAALAKNLGGAHVVAIDRSRRAARVARKNIRNLGLSGRVDVQIANFARPRAISGHFDIIVSNPPYIARGDTRVDTGAMHDPKIALYAGNNGFAAYADIAKNARNWIRPGGRIYLEIGDGAGQGVQKIFTDAGWMFVNQLPDLAGINRVMIFSGPK